jgi:NADP-dependent 3-hydroxy acid dehydrogenase YdfG
MRKIALVTGATSGIGRAAALILAQNEYDVIITGRREALLRETAEKIRDTSGAEVLQLTFDVRDKTQVAKYLGSLEGKWQQVDVLINNAGLASGLSYIHEGDIDDWEKMIDTNIKGLLYVTRIISPGMVKWGKGHIVNIGSIAGKEVYEKGNVYCATKHAVDALNKGMRTDLVDYNIKVTAINPGAVKTEFSMVRFHGDKEKADQVYEGFTPLLEQDIAEAILFAVTRPPHVNINDMLIMSTAQASSSKTAKKM